MQTDWISEFPAAITVTDMDGVIIEMNDKACQTFEKYGGNALIGTNLMKYHAAKSQEIIKQIMTSGEKNVYSIEKNGMKKIIFQTPWYIDGVIMGLVELSLEVPFEMPHFVRT